MNTEVPHNAPLFNQVLQRFSKLNEAGRHTFIGRLIEDARGNAHLEKEIRNALQRLESDTHLAICLNPAEPSHGTALRAPAKSNAALLLQRSRKRRASRKKRSHGPARPTSVRKIRPALAGRIGR